MGRYENLLYILISVVCLCLAMLLTTGLRCTCYLDRIFDNSRSLSDNWANYSATNEEDEVELARLIYVFKDGIDDDDDYDNASATITFGDIKTTRKNENVASRSVIVSSRGSGSEFIGDNVIKAHPSSFYVSEPFFRYKFKLYRNTSITRTALEELDAMLECDYSRLGDDHLNSDELYSRLSNDNVLLQKRCLQLRNEDCRSELFLSNFCKQFSLRAINTDRLSLKFMEMFLKRKEPNVKIVLLIRDPRQVMTSRKSLNDECLSDANCLDPSILCYDMVEDYRAAVKFSKHHDESFRIIRYEDMARDPYEVAAELFKFYDQPFGDLNFDTILSMSNDWDQKLEYDEVKDIQSNCKLAMKLWGYLPVDNRSEYTEGFDPITNYTLDDTYE